MGDSPPKKLDFKPVDKENLKGDAPAVTDLELKKAHVDVVEKGQRPAVACGIKHQEADEPLLQENPHRFVLFPIKYHEVGVRDASRVECFSSTGLTRCAIDMEDVQEGRGLFLDGRRSRPVEGPARLEQPIE